MQQFPATQQLPKYITGQAVTKRYISFFKMDEDVPNLKAILDDTDLLFSLKLEAQPSKAICTEMKLVKLLIENQRQTTDVQKRQNANNMLSGYKKSTDLFDWEQHIEDAHNIYFSCEFGKLMKIFDDFDYEEYIGSQLIDEDSEEQKKRIYVPYLINSYCLLRRGDIVISPLLLVIQRQIVGKFHTVQGILEQFTADRNQYCITRVSQAIHVWRDPITYLKKCLSDNLVSIDPRVNPVSIGKINVDGKTDTEYSIIVDRQDIISITCNGRILNYNKKGRETCDEITMCEVKVNASMKVSKRDADEIFMIIEKIIKMRKDLDQEHKELTQRCALYQQKAVEVALAKRKFWGDADVVVLNVLVYDAHERSVDTTLWRCVIDKLYYDGEELLYSLERVRGCIPENLEKRVSMSMKSIRSQR